VSTPKVGDTVELGGIPVQIGSEEECEATDFVVCVPRSCFPRDKCFPDNVETVCCDCGTAVIHRPYAPKRPPRICIGCMIARAEAQVPG
jgi:hypothetical protein